MLIEGLQTMATLDRRGDALFCGGDDLFSWAAAELGRGFGIFPELHYFIFSSENYKQ